MDDVHDKLARMIGAAHKRLGRACRFPPEMISDLYVCIHDKREAPRPHGWEHTYCRSWIDRWVQSWYYKNRADQTLEEHQLTKTLTAPCEDEYLRLDENEKWEVRDTLHELGDRHREVIMLYFGIEYGWVYSVREIARRFNMSTQRISQVLQDALFAFATAALRNKITPSTVSADRWQEVVRALVVDRLDKQKQREDPNHYKDNPTRMHNPRKPAQIKPHKHKESEVKRLQALLLWKKINRDSTFVIEEARLQELLA